MTHKISPIRAALGQIDGDGRRTAGCIRPAARDVLRVTCYKEKEWRVEMQWVRCAGVRCEVWAVWCMGAVRLFHLGGGEVCEVGGGGG